MSEQPDVQHTHGVRIDASLGEVAISLGGETLPRGQITAYVLQHDVHTSLPQLILHTRQPEGVLFEGLATVAVAVPQDPSGVIVEFLQGIDPAILSRAALDRDDLDDGKHGVIQACLRQLAEWAKGEG